MKAEHTDSTRTFRAGHAGTGGAGTGGIGAGGIGAGGAWTAGGAATAGGGAGGVRLAGGGARGRAEGRVLGGRVRGRVRSGRVRGPRVGALAAAVAVAVPLVVAGTATPAAADAGTLQVTALDRAGAAGPQWMWVTDLATGQSSETRSGGPQSFAAGRYAITVTIREHDASAATLAGAVVTVSDDAPTAVTLDARQGRALTVALDSGPGAGYTQSFGARICVAGRQVGYGPSEHADAGALYVVPNADQELSLGYTTLWKSPAQPDVYAAAGTASLTEASALAVSRASMGTVDAKVMRGPDTLDGDATAFVDPTPQDAGCQQGIWVQHDFTAVPFERRFHVTPGAWRFESSSGTGAWHRDEAVAAGGSAEVDFNHAVWGPARYLPWVDKGTIGFFTGGLFADPVLDGVDSSINANVSLYRDGRLVASKSHLGNYSGTAVRTFHGPVAAAGTYTLKAHGVRYATGVPMSPTKLSSATDVAFTFHAGPTSTAVAPGMLTHFVPGGLNPYNRAKAGSATSIALTLDRISTQAGIPLWPSTAARVEVFASTNGGASWAPLKVAHTAAGWSALLHTPGSGSELSLSSRVTDTGGNTTVTTVYRAFTVA